MCNLASCSPHSVHTFFSLNSLLLNNEVLFLLCFCTPVLVLPDVILLTSLTVRKRVFFLPCQCIEASNQRSGENQRKVEGYTTSSSPEDFMYRACCSPFRVVKFLLKENKPCHLPTDRGSTAQQRVDFFKNFIIG